MVFLYPGPRASLNDSDDGRHSGTNPTRDRRDQKADPSCRTFRKASRAGCDYPGESPRRRIGIGRRRLHGRRRFRLRLHHPPPPPPPQPTSAAAKTTDSIRFIAPSPSVAGISLSRERIPLGNPRRRIGADRQRDRTPHAAPGRSRQGSTREGRPPRLRTTVNRPASAPQPGAEGDAPAPRDRHRQRRRRCGRDGYALRAKSVRQDYQTPRLTTRRRWLRWLEPPTWRSEAPP